MILVFAGTPHEANSFIEKIGLKTKEEYFRIVRSLSLLDFMYGTDNCILVFVGTWYKRDTREIIEVEDYCRSHNIIMLKEGL